MCTQGAIPFAVPIQCHGEGPTVDGQENLISDTKYATHSNVERLPASTQRFCWEFVPVIFIGSGVWGIDPVMNRGGM
eukprot:177870-Amphidinium_carterae.1